MNNKKKVFVATIKCPSCQAVIEVLKEVEVIREAVKGERKERYFAENIDVTSKDVESLKSRVQTTLQEELKC